MSLLLLFPSSFLPGRLTTVKKNLPVNKTTLEVQEVFWLLPRKKERLEIGLLVFAVYFFGFFLITQLFFLQNE